jgi:hypothetical protein
MSLSWKLYRIVCFFQTVIAAYIMLTALLSFVQYPSFSDAARVLLFLLVMMLSIFAINTLNNHYPDIPIEAGQKKVYNRLFLINFLLLALFFGFVFAEYRVLIRFMRLIDKTLLYAPFTSYISFVTYTISLIFQLIILSGLYKLRFLLYDNFRKKKFDFEA